MKYLTQTIIATSWYYVHSIPYVQSWIIMLYMQYIIITNINYYCNLTQILFQHKNTIIALYSIVYDNMIYLSTTIFILTDHTTLAFYAYKSKLFSSKCNDDILFLS